MAASFRTEWRGVSSDKSSGCRKSSRQRGEDSHDRHDLDTPARSGARARKAPVAALPPRHRNRHPHARHGRRAAGHLGRLRHLQRHPRPATGFSAALPDAAQPLEPVGPDSSIAVMATGMVLVIVMRHIDLSVGSILGFDRHDHRRRAGQFLIRALGSASAIPSIWIIALLLGIALGAAIGALPRLLIAYLGIPAFIVTLGGLLVWRGAAWWVIRGADRGADGQDLQADRRRAASARSARPRAGSSALSPALASSP